MDRLDFLDSEVDMPLMKLPVRTPVITLDKGKIMISPGSRLSENQYRSIPDVTDIVAPNLFHCAGITSAAQFFPKASLWAPPGGKRLKPQISWTKEINEVSWPYQEQLPIIHIEGMPKVHEVLFFHRSSKSLIVTDLCFNLLESKGFGAWLILGLFGTYRKFGVSKFFLRFVKDRNLMTQSLTKLFSYDFENIVVSHGHNITGNAKKYLKEALLERGLEIR